MIENKRFELNVNQHDQCDIVDWVESKEKNAICIYNDLGNYCFSSAKALCELLNELYEDKCECENEIARLKMIIAKLEDKDYDNYAKKIKELSEENKELKEENQELLGLVQEDVDSWSDGKKEALCDMLNAILGDFE